MRVQLVKGIALVSTGLLAGAFGYGAVNLAPTFDAVPIEMRLSFHAELMKMNSPVMQTAMAVSTLSSLVLTFLTRGTARLLAGGATALTAASFLITRFGNVPINADIKKWAVTSAPPNHGEILDRWELFNQLRTGTAVIALVLLSIMAVGRFGDRPARSEERQPQLSDA
ncbi:anthrone oxygenase family protein [Streptomyces sp. NPDC048436]|uniref:anthrone oxygenase family protein n=1 Tax=Streptomyces sp. NPDC048436 TaxID=3365550 RepID=UPI00371AF1FE